MRIIPTKNQWKNWSLPSKLTAIGTYVGLLSFFVTIMFFVFEDNAELPQSCRFYGVVRDIQKNPLPHTEIEVREVSTNGRLIGKGQTKNNGEFDLIVRARPQSTVWVRLTRNNIVGFENYILLIGNHEIIFGKQQ